MLRCGHSRVAQSHCDCANGPVRTEGPGRPATPLQAPPLPLFPAPSWPRPFSIRPRPTLPGWGKVDISE